MHEGCREDSDHLLVISKFRKTSQKNKKLVQTARWNIAAFKDIKKQQDEILTRKLREKNHIETNDIEKT